VAPRPYGPRLSCGRNARWRKVVASPPNSLLDRVKPGPLNPGPPEKARSDHNNDGVTGTRRAAQAVATLTRIVSAATATPARPVTAITERRLAQWRVARTVLNSRAGPGSRSAFPSRRTAPAPAAPAAIPPNVRIPREDRALTGKASRRRTIRRPWPPDGRNDHVVRDRGFHQSDMMRVLEDGDDREQKHHHRDTGRKTGSRVDVTCRGDWRSTPGSSTGAGGRSRRAVPRVDHQRADRDDGKPIALDEPVESWDRTFDGRLTDRA